MGIPVSFLELRWEVGSIEWAGIRQDGKWLVLNAQDGKFPEFSRKNLGTQKMRLGTQPLISQQLFHRFKKIVKLCKYETNWRGTSGITGIWTQDYKSAVKKPCQFINRSYVTNILRLLIQCPWAWLKHYIFNTLSSKFFGKSP